MLVLLLVLAACSEDAGEASPDEYAVWSAAVDAAFGATPYRRLTVDPTTVAPIADSVSMAYIRQGGLPDEVVRDYVARNTVPVRIRASKLATQRVTVTGPMPEWALRTLNTMGVVDTRLMVSRVGFDAYRTHAVVLVIAQYQAGKTLLMKRGRDGTWRQKAILEFWRS
ncbi:MAG TPA: hypothetical protein VFS20_12295 [Longimicrobium sp.]|nr:hypothetical protein [Longimicrobium sp.]